jgi:hypothetical protein
MTEDSWPLPRYATAGKQHLHAIGVIVQNFNQFEYAFFRLFAHHLERQKISVKLAWVVCHQLHDYKRPEVIQLMFSEYERDAVVKDHVAHSLDFFDRCTANRNLIFHSRVDLNHPFEEMMLTKGIKKDWEQVNYAC